VKLLNFLSNKITLLSLLVFSIASANASVKSFTLTTDKTDLSTGEAIIVMAELNIDKKSNIVMPQFPVSEEYKVVGSDSRQSSSSSISIVNGRRSVSKNITTSYYYKVLFPKTGKVTLPPLKISVDGEEHSTEGISFNIGVKRVVRNVSVVFNRPKKILYKGEQSYLNVELRFKNESSAKPTNEGINKFITDFSKEIETKFATSLTIDQIEPKHKTINGVSHLVIELPYLVTPLSDGDITVGPLTLNYVNQKQVQSRDAFGGSFFGGSSLFSRVENSAAVASTPKLNYTVKTLPLPPKNYNGAIGKIRLTGKLSSNSVPSGEGVTLSLTVSGKMRAKALGDISVPAIDGVEQFTPEKTVTTDTTSYGFRSKKRYNYMLIPHNEGVVTVPAVEVVWFNTETGAYVTEKAGPFNLTVTKGVMQKIERRRYLTKESLNAVGDDIRFIKTSLPTKAENVKSYKSDFYIYLLLTPWFLALILLVIKIRVRFLPKNRANEKKRKALGLAVKELHNIEIGKSAESPVASVERYLASTTGTGVGSVTRVELEGQLKLRGVSDDSTTALSKFLEGVEMQRYAGVSSVASAKEGIALLKKIDKEISK
jgi:hypothetical protein